MIKCENCGKELAPDTAFCDGCGAVVPNPNNRNEINKLFASEYESDDYEQESTQKETDEIGIDKVDFDTLTDDEMQRIADSGVILEHQLQKEINEEQNAAIQAAEAEEEKKDPKAYKKKRRDELKKKKKTEKSKELSVKKNKSAVRTIIIFVSVFIISAALGIAGTIFFLYSRYVDSEWIYGYNASVTIENSLPKGQKFIPCEIYLKEYEGRMECVVFGEIRRKAGDYEDVRYRMSVNKKNPKDVLVYAPFDAEKYNSMKNGTAEEQIAAALMKKHEEILETEIADMNRSKNDWIKLKLGYITARLGD